MDVSKGKKERMIFRGENDEFLSKYLLIILNHSCRLHWREICIEG